MKKELKKEFKTNQAIEKLKNLNCEVIDIYEKGYVVYISFKKLADDFSVSMLGYFDEKSSAVHDNILEIK